MIPDTEVGTESMYNLFNEKGPPVFPRTFSYNAAAASNSKSGPLGTEIGPVQIVCRFMVTYI